MNWFWRVNFTLICSFDAQSIGNQVILCLFLMINGSMFGYFFLQHALLAYFTNNWHFWAFKSMCFHGSTFHFVQAILAWHFNLRNYFPGDFGRMPCYFRIPTARTMPKFLEDVGYALLAIYFGATGRFDCIFGKFQAQRAYKILLHIKIIISGNIIDFEFIHVGRKYQYLASPYPTSQQLACPHLDHQC